MSDEMEQQPQVRSSPYSSPMYNYGSAILFLTNPESELRKLELTMRCVRIDEYDNPIKMGEPLMNEYGISSVIGMIQALVNQVSIMSNLDKNNIAGLIDYLGDTLAKDLMMNRHEYGLVSTTARDKIYYQALSTSFITLKRAYEEGDKRFWKGSVQEIRTTHEREKSGGVLSGLNPWRNK